MAQSTNPTIVPTVIRKWELEDGTQVRPVSNVEDYKPSELIKVKELDAKKTYVRLADYKPSTRTSATTENLVASAMAEGLTEEQARKIVANAKALSAKK